MRFPPTVNVFRTSSKRVSGKALDSKTVGRADVAASTDSGHSVIQNAAQATADKGNIGESPGLFQRLHQQSLQRISAEAACRAYVIDLPATAFENQGIDDDVLVGGGTHPIVGYKGATTVARVASLFSVCKVKDWTVMPCELVVPPPSIGPS